MYIYTYIYIYIKFVKRCLATPGRAERTAKGALHS